MTLCVAFCGSDGVLLAADRREAEYTDGPNEFDHARFTYYGKKVFRSEKHGIVVACSGNCKSHEIAMLCLNQLDCYDRLPEETISTILWQTTNNWRASARSNGEVGGDAGPLLFIVPSAEFPLYKLIVNPDPQAPQVIASGSKAFIGFTYLTSLFFAERFYDASDEHTVDELAFLAGHIILTAGRMHQDVAGLDVFALRRGGCIRYTRGQLDEIRKRSDELEHEIRGRLFLLPRRASCPASCDTD